MEAAGIEPASESAQPSASTCVSPLLVLAAEVPVGRVILTNTAAEGSGGIQLARLVVRAGSPTGASLALGGIAGSLVVYHDGAPWGASQPLTADSLTASSPGSSPTIAFATC